MEDAVGNPMSTWQLNDLVPEAYDRPYDAFSAWRLAMSNQVLPRLQGQGSARVRIQAIEVDLSSTIEHPICLKILLNGQVNQRLNQIGVGEPLHWGEITPINANPRDYIEIRAYEVHFWRKIRIGAVRFRAHHADHSSNELRVNDNTGLVPCFFKLAFAPPDLASSAPHLAYGSAAAAINQKQSALQSMGRTRTLIDTILTITEQASELNPMAHATVNVCKIAWEVLQQQGECDRLMAELIVGMGDMLPYIDAVKDKAKVIQLKTTIANLLNLIEDASRFVIEYKLDGVAVRTVRSFITSTAQEQVDELLKRFKSLKEEFDRGMITQMILGMEVFLNDADREILSKLITPDAGFDPATGCLEGTRKTIRNDIQQWAHGDAPSPPIFWLYGLAGCGKSTVARSVSMHLDETNRLGGAFFCRRDNEHLCKPEHVVSTLAAHLAFVCPTYGARLVTALRAKPQLTSSALAIRSRGMLVEPTKAMGNQVEQSTSVIIVDALDECGTPDTRTQLLASLIEMLKLAPWLKLIITSRPNEELVAFFRKNGSLILHRDLFQEDPVSVYSDICLFIRARLEQLMDDDEALRESRWLDDETVNQLASRANGLFIWARTACNVICNSVNPDEKIKNRLAGKTSHDTNEQLGLLYTTVLSEALGRGIDDTQKIRCCIAVVIVTRVPLVDTALVDLLSGRITLIELRLVVRRLGSVLYRDQSGAVRVVHQSFSDYMVDERCPPQYRMDRDLVNIALAASCLRIMVKELRFNICNLEDSRAYNHDIPDLATRVEADIGPHLAYSCVYWAKHLSDTLAFNSALPEHQAIVELVDKLLKGPEALYWIEALSLLNKLYTSQPSLIDLTDWMQSSIPVISTHASELQSFVAAFYLPISQSTPHLYVSAVAFGSEQSDVIRSLKDKFPNVVQVTRGRHLGKLSNRWLKAIQHSSSVQAVAYSADGKLLAAGAGDLVHVWEALTGTAILNPLRGHSDVITSVAFSPDGRHIVSGSNDKTIRAWNVRTGVTVLSPLEGHSKPVTSVSVSPDTQCIVSGSEDHTICVWSFHTGAALNLLTGHSGAVTSVSVSPNGQYIASGSEDYTVRVWDLHTRAAALHVFRGHSFDVRSVAFSPDGQYIVSGSFDWTVRVWDLRTGAAAIEPLRGHLKPVTSVAFSPDGQYVVSSSWDNTIQVWSLRNSAATISALAGHSDTVTCVAYSPDGKHIASGSEDQTLRIWDLHNYNKTITPNPLQGHPNWVTSVAFSPDGRHLVSGSADQTVRVWDVHTGIAVFDPFQGHSKQVTSVAFSPSSEYIASGSFDKTVRVWSTHTNPTTLHSLQEHLLDVDSVAFSPDGKSIVSGSSDHTVRVWSTDTGAATLNPLEGHSEIVASVAVSADGKYIVSGSWDTTVRVWHLLTGAPAFGPLHGHSKSVMSVACSPDSRYIVSGSEDHTIRIWELHTGATTFETLRGHSDSVLSVACSPDGKYIVSGSYDNTVRVWDMRTGTTMFGPLEGHGQAVASVAFSPDSQRIASGSWDNTVRFWEIPSSSTLPNNLPHDFPFSSSSPSHVLSHQLAESLTLTHDGWVLDQNQRPLLWLPAHLQRRQADYSTTAISINSSDHPVSFDFSKFKCGTDWGSICDTTAI